MWQLMNSGKGVGGGEWGTLLCTHVHLTACRLLPFQYPLTTSGRDGSGVGCVRLTAGSVLGKNTHISGARTCSAAP